MKNKDEIQIPVDIDRVCVEVTLKKPFIDWLVENHEKYDKDASALTPAEVEKDAKETKNIYLMPSFEEEEQNKLYVKMNYEKIFVNELFGWYIEPSMWPQERTWEVFNEWIDYKIQEMVFDLEECHRLSDFNFER